MALDSTNMNKLITVEDLVTYDNEIKDRGLKIYVDAYEYLESNDRIVVNVHLNKSLFSTCYVRLVSSHQSYASNPSVDPCQLPFITSYGTTAAWFDNISESGIYWQSGLYVQLEDESGNVLASTKLSNGAKIPVLYDSIINKPFLNISSLSQGIAVDANGVLEYVGDISASDIRFDYLSFKGSYDVSSGYSASIVPVVSIDVNLPKYMKGDFIYYREYHRYKAYFQFYISGPSASYTTKASTRSYGTVNGWENDGRTTVTFESYFDGDALPCEDIYNAYGISVSFFIKDEDSDTKVYSSPFLYIESTDIISYNEVPRAVLDKKLNKLIVFADCPQKLKFNTIDVYGSKYVNTNYVKDDSKYLGSFTPLSNTSVTFDIPEWLHDYSTLVYDFSPYERIPARYVTGNMFVIYDKLDTKSSSRTINRGPSTHTFTEYFSDSVKRKNIRCEFEISESWAVSRGLSIVGPYTDPSSTTARHVDVYVNWSVIPDSVQSFDFNIKWLSEIIQ